MGPADEKLASWFGAPDAEVVTAATVIAEAELPGDADRAAPELAVVVAGSDDRNDARAAAAASSARATMSRDGSISGSPIERLITSIPSATAASIAATISGELPSRPKSASVGMVSAL